MKVTKDVPPFTLIGRNPARIESINKVGLRRRGFSNETIQKIDDFLQWYISATIMSVMA
ncbi:MAG: hypothetical protein IPK11_15565 [Ignavibacteria bacterium]|nr:hypothetical protein [Ignavibacteria bacterium]